MREFKPELMRKARLEAGLSQYQLADKLGTRQHQISRLETGRRRPSLSRVMRLAEAIGCPPEALLGEVADDV